MRGEVLVAIMNNRLDFGIAADRHWYRVPVDKQEKWLANRWPPRWLAFYQTKVFGAEAHAVHWYAAVNEIRKVSREELFPGQPHDKKSRRLYYQLCLGSLERLPRPIPSRRLRRVVFIPTTSEKLFNATEINDLYDDSALEDCLWTKLRDLKVAAERQEYVTVKKRNYALDFAIYCAEGKLDIETDGDFWHANPERAPEDNIRDNDLASVGWTILRFNDRQIQEGMQEYCVPKIAKTINRLGGLKETDFIVRKIDLNTPSGMQQLTLFDNL